MCCDVRVGAVSGHWGVVLPLRGTLRVFSGSFEAGLAEQAVTPCCFGLVGVLPLSLVTLRGLNISFLRVQKAKRAVQTIPWLCLLCFFFPLIKLYK